MNCLSARPGLDLNFVVYVGMGKAGSGLINKVIKQHPDICITDYKKEINFFSKRANWKQGLDWYLSRFQNPERYKYVGDISPHYHTRRVARGRIVETLGRGTKIIFCLRDYADFAFSRYLQIIRSEMLPGSFWEHLKVPNRIVRPLDEIVEGYLDDFGQENVLILRYELDFKQPEMPFEQKIYRFLGLPDETTYYHHGNDSKANAGTMPRFVYDRDAEVVETYGKRTYRVPPDTLVFCSGPNQYRVWEHPDAETLAWARDLEAGWTTAIAEDDYRCVQETISLPLAERLEEKFGLDLSHWRHPPKARSYGPARLPKIFYENFNQAAASPQG